jgi:phosphohistidine phosphatase
MPKPKAAPTRHLWILRHAKAASDAPWGGSDKERPLTARGRRDATALGSRLAADTPLPGLEGVRKPDLAICSAAVRTRQTAELLIKEMGGRVPLDSYGSLYDADTATVLRYVREIDEGVRSALLIGHNPTMFRLAVELVDKGGPDLPAEGDRGILEDHGFPTCALAVVALGADGWEDVAHGDGSLVAVFRPPY